MISFSKLLAKQLFRTKQETFHHSFHDTQRNVAVKVWQIRILIEKISS